MRLNECQDVQKTLERHLGISLTVIDGSELFLSRLKGITEPETKRKIIGGTFIDLFEAEAIRIEKEAENTANAGKVEFFVQGTLYPDVIESLSFHTNTTIKSKHTCLCNLRNSCSMMPILLSYSLSRTLLLTINIAHHNVGGLPARMMNGVSRPPEQNLHVTND